MIKPMDTFVISLLSRLDRRTVMEKGLSKLSINFKFIDAIDVENYNKRFDTNFIISKNAIWCSHVLAYEDFLSTSFEWAIIMEDDIDFENSSLLSEAEILNFVQKLTKNSLQIDMIQFGYNDEKSNSVRQKMSDLFFEIFKFRRYETGDLIRSITELKFRKFLLLSCALSSAPRKVLALNRHSERGCHYYLVNRALASHMVDYFYERSRDVDLIPIDTYLHSLSKTHPIFKIIRPSSPLAIQSQSPSSNIA